MAQEVARIPGIYEKPSISRTRAIVPKFVVHNNRIRQSRYTAASVSRILHKNTVCTHVSNRVVANRCVLDGARAEVLVQLNAPRRTLIQVIVADFQLSVCASNIDCGSGKVRALIIAEFNMGCIWPNDDESLIVVSLIVRNRDVGRITVEVDGSCVAARVDRNVPVEDVIGDNSTGRVGCEDAIVFVSEEILADH